MHISGSVVAGSHAPAGHQRADGAPETLLEHAGGSGDSHPGSRCGCPATLDRCAAAYREEYTGNEYGRLTLEVTVFDIILCSNVFRGRGELPGGIQRPF